MKRSVAVMLMLSVILTACASGDDPPDDAATPAHPAIGTYTTTIPAKDIKKFDYLDETFTGEWVLTIEADRYSLTHGESFRVFEDVALDDEEMSIDATPAPVGAYNCYDDDGERMVDEGLAAGTYGFSLADGSLLLEALDEPCPIRLLFLEREWQGTSG